MQQVDVALATDLASHYRSLAQHPERALAACSSVLREVSSDLVALFGAASGIELRADIDRLSLPGFQRRALVLAARELAGNALQHAWRGSPGGTLTMTLKRFGDHARLTVADDGAGCVISPKQAQQGMVGALADLLDGTVLYQPGRPAGTVAEIRFPLPG